MTRSLYAAIVVLHCRSGKFCVPDLENAHRYGRCGTGFYWRNSYRHQREPAYLQSDQIKAAVQTSNTCVLIAISLEKHQEAARSRLIVAGVNPLLILNLESETSLTFLWTLHQEGIKLPELLQVPLSDIPSLEQRIAQLKSTKAVGKKPNQFQFLCRRMCRRRWFSSARQSFGGKAD